MPVTKLSPACLFILKRNVTQSHYSAVKGMNNSITHNVLIFYLYPLSNNLIMTKQHLPSSSHYDLRQQFYIFRGKIIKCFYKSIKKNTSWLINEKIIKLSFKNIVYLKSNFLLSIYQFKTDSKHSFLSLSKLHFFNLF